MKTGITFSMLSCMLLFASIAQGQITAKTYMSRKNPFQLDSVSNQANIGFTGINQPSHIWLMALNSQYVNSATNHINSFAVPAYIPIKKGSLLNPYSATNQFISALLPYGYNSPYAQYQPTTNKTYQAIPYGYPPYSVGASRTPYFIFR